jgi:hypothetical protein
MSSNEWFTVEELTGAVKATPAYEDLGLTDQDVGRVVTTLHLYQCQEVAETVDRNRSRRKDQKRQIGALRTSFEDATKVCLRGTV